MGCISSKIMSRAVSFNEDRLNHSHSLRKSNAVPLLEGLIMFTSTPRHTTTTNDQLHANLVSSSSSNSSSNTANKQQTELGTFPKPPTIEVEPRSPPITHTVNTWELMEGLEEEEEEEEEQAVLDQQLQELSISVPLDADVLVKESRRSKSCQWFLADMEGELNEKLGSVVLRSCRSTSFHTVEEYNALLQNIWLSSRRPNDHQSAPFESSSMSQHPNHNDADDTQETVKPPWLMHKQQQLLLQGNNKITVTEEGIGIWPFCPDISGIIEESASSSSSNFKEDKGVMVEKRIHEKGLRRRAIAQGLESLKIPPTTTIEFPTPPGVTNFRKWGDVEDQVYSPGAVSSSSSYVTPKFGSYNVPSTDSSRMGKDHHWGVSKEEGMMMTMMLNPELVAAFEECMQQLQLEEESLLHQIIEANDTMDKEAQHNDDSYLS